MAHDYKAIARQFLRALRHKHSQIAFSRRLGFDSNVAAQWESGRRIPPVLTALHACQRVRIDVRSSFATFRPATGHLVTGGSKQLDLQTVARWLDAQRGKETISSIAQRASLSRYQTARFFAGDCEPRLHDFLALIDATTGRLSDLIALLVDIDRLPALTDHHSQVVASRRLAFDEPWSSAVLSAVECLSDVECGVVAETIARVLGIEQDQTARCLRRLEQAGVVRQTDGTYRVSAPLTVDTGAVRDGARKLRQHWSEVAHERLEGPRPNDVFSYNVFSVSREDLLLIGRLQREHFQRIRAIIAKSSCETVALLNMHLMEWDPTTTDQSTAQ